MIKFLFVGRLDPQKNPIMLLKVAQHVVDCYPDTRFTLVGDGEKYAECKAFIEEHQLGNNVTLAGWQNNVTPFYKNHDIFAMTSIYEAFGLIFVEAGYHHLPTIATNVEGIPEVVKDGETGLLCDANDVAKMTENAIRLIEHPEERKRLGDQEYKYVTTQFASSIMVDKYRTLYERDIVTNESRTDSIPSNCPVCGLKADSAELQRDERAGDEKEQHHNQVMQP